MVEGKDHRCAHMLFIFLAAFVDRCTGYEEHGYLTDMNTRDSDISNRISDD